MKIEELNNFINKRRNLGQFLPLRRGFHAPNIMKPTLINLKALQDIKNKLQTNIQNQVKQTVIKQGCSSCGGGGGTIK